MSYAAYSDLLKHYSLDDITLISDKNREGVPNMAVIDTALKESTAEINGYVRVRYKLPLSMVSDELVRACCVIARYWMESHQNTEKAIKDYQRIIRMLEELRDGESSLGLSDDDLLPEQAGGSIQMESSEPVWTREKSQGYI